MRERREIFMGCAVVLGAVALPWFTACHGHRQESVVIGAVLPLTGSAAQWGRPPRDAAIMAVEEVNSHGGIKGRKIGLDVQDGKCEPSVGVSAIQQILASDKPVAVVGGVCSSVTLAMAPIAERNRVVLISPASTSPLLTHKGEYIFRVIPSDALRGKVFAQHVYSLGHRRICLLYINNDGGVGNEKSFAENFQRLGGAVLSTDAYPQDTRDVRAQLTKSKQQKLDALVVVSYPDDTPIVLRQARELNVTAPLFFQTEALDDPAVIQKAGAAAEGATYILPMKPSGPAIEAFVQAYKIKYGRDPELFAAEGYDCVMLIAKVLEGAPQISSDALRDGLRRTYNYQGASGIITFDENGDVVKPMEIKRIVGGMRQAVETR